MFPGGACSKAGPARPVRARCSQQKNYPGWPAVRPLRGLPVPRRATAQAICQRSLAARLVEAAGPEETAAAGEMLGNDARKCPTADCQYSGDSITAHSAGRVAQRFSPQAMGGMVGSSGLAGPTRPVSGGTLVSLHAPSLGIVKRLAIAISIELANRVLQQSIWDNTLVSRNRRYASAQRHLVVAESVSTCLLAVSWLPVTEKFPERRGRPGPSGAGVHEPRRGGNEHLHGIYVISPRPLRTLPYTSCAALSLLGAGRARRTFDPPCMTATPTANAARDWLPTP
jgi:hypothetical protein